MNVTFLSTLALLVSKYFPEEMDLSLKPKDSSNCQLCRKIRFDYIIVGGGSAGCVLANRLSENPNWNILLLEAGEDESYITDVPILNGILAQTKYDWNYTTVKQERACYGTDGYCHYPAGHVMGGTSTINGMDYVRGNPEDYNEWEALGNEGWDYKNVLYYFLKAENMTIQELAKGPYHSVNGPLRVGYSRYRTNISKDFIKAALDNGLNEIDYNGKNQIGVANLQLTLNGPTRCSTSKAYLNPIRNRTNLYIFKNTEANKILLNSKKKKVIGVNCITGKDEYIVYTKKEIIVSAGVMNTPKLLMLSGIGPRKHLEELNIPVYADLPVGENFIDHNGLSLYFSVNKTALNCCEEFTDEVILEYARDRKGPLTSPFQEIVAFMNIMNTNNTIPNITLIMGVISQQFTNTNDPIVFIYIGNLSPKSIGNIKLKSQNYIDQPLVDPNYFNSDIDLISIRKGIRKVINFIESPSMKKYSLKWIKDMGSKCNISDDLTDEYLDCFIKYTSMPGYHGVGTARMGPLTDRTTVVNSKLKVHTIKNLRIVDASIMPRITRGNTNAPTIMIAEKAADLIKNF